MWNVFDSIQYESIDSSPDGIVCSVSHSPGEYCFSSIYNELVMHHSL